MYLTPIQREVFELIRKYITLRYDQIQALMDILQGKKVRGIKAMLRQLELAKLIYWTEHLCTAAGKSVRSDISDAVDVMLQLTHDLSNVLIAEPPFALTFFRERDNILYRYDICPVIPGKELILSAQLEQIRPKYRVVIFVLQDLQQREYLSAPCDYRYAVKENGTYNFYEEGK